MISTRMENGMDDQTESAKEALSKMLESRLTSVQFVLDYLILGFDQKAAFTSLVWPVIDDEQGKSQYGSSEYRDRLCALIEQTVVGCDLDQSDKIKITFKNGATLKIDLGSYTGEGERGILTAPNHFLFVF